MSEYFVHPSAIVESRDIGDDTKIWAFSHVLPGAKIGSNVNIADHCFIENEVVIGNNVTLKCGIYIWDGIAIEDDVFIGPAAVLTNDLNPRSKNSNYVQQKTLFKKGCSIGANATILPGITIGEYALVGAGAVVTKNVKNFSVVRGNPAQESGYVCKCGNKLEFEQDKADCSCKQSYEIINNQIQLI